MAYAVITSGERAAGQIVTESLLSRLRDNPASIATQDATAVFRRFNLPPFLHWFGNGVMGSLSLNTQSVLGGVYYATDFTIPVGQTLTVTSGILCVYATTSITIDGAIDASGPVRSTATSDNIFDKVASAEIMHGYALGGSGGGAGALDIATPDSRRSHGGWAVGIKGGEVSTGYPATGSPGRDREPTDINGRGRASVLSMLGASWQGGASGGTGMNNTDPKAYGGGFIVLISPLITIPVSGSFDVRGKVPVDPGGIDDMAGSGGGAGGSIVIAGQTVSYLGSANVTGAAGSSGVGTIQNASAGGTGGDGQVFQITIPS